MCAVVCVSVFAHLYLLLYYLLLQVAPLLRRGLKAVARSDRVLDRVREVRFEDLDLDVRMTMLQTQVKLEAEALVKHAIALIAMFEDSDSGEC